MAFADLSIHVLLGATLGTVRTYRPSRLRSIMGARPRRRDPIAVPGMLGQD